TAMPKEVEALRSSLDTRLTALEQALADPTQHGSLEALILDLARIATEEADATTRHAVLDAQKLADDGAAKALEAEKQESAALREVIEKAKSALKQAEAALKDERRTAEAATREVEGAHRELAAIRESLEQQQTASVAQRREFDAAVAAVEAERARASAMEEQVAHARAQGESERASLISELADARAALESERRESAQLLQTSSELEQQLATARGDVVASRGELDAARRDVETVRAELEAARRELDATRGELEATRGQLDATQGQLDATQGQLDATRGELDATRGELDATRGELDATRGERDATRDERDAAKRDLDDARREIDGIRADSDARTQTLSRSQADQELALKAAQDSARGAEARLEQAVRERDDAQNVAADLRQQLQAAEGVIGERDALKRELQAAQEAQHARDAADELETARKTLPDIEFDADSDTVVDLTSMSKEEERQLAIENRIRALELALRDAETRAESAELELDLQRRAAPARKAAPSFEPLPPLEVVAPAPAVAAEVTDASTAEVFRGPARAAKRVQFKGETEIQVDGVPGKLVDLSVTGAQLLTAAAMKPNRLIKVTLPMGDTSIACKAKVMWSRLEPRSGQLWYRAGVSFTSADQLSLETFIDQYQK
ncbi:MAG TPA: PilZ domain-containing protein, partial [Vicinamibacterales bacterium]|nr:PilZ domain-containing protein [Vicinamibacterales bacterium]